MYFAFLYYTKNEIDIQVIHARNTINSLGGGLSYKLLIYIELQLSSF